MKVEERTKEFTELLDEYKNTIQKKCIADMQHNVELSRIYYITSSAYRQAIISMFRNDYFKEVVESLL